MTRIAGPRAWFRAFAVIACLSLCVPSRAVASAGDDEEDELRRLTLEQLLEVEISTVSRMPESLLRASAAVTVLTRGDLLRSGATTLADALRLVPGVHVAQIDSNKWALGIRGFADRLSRSMLVMIDGRAVYSPLFAGTYWEVQDTLLDDVERVEVVRGPGGTLWGANAVNGIVNVVTRPAAETQGTFATAGTGSVERGFGAIRYGGQRGATSYRGYAKAFGRGPGHRGDGADFDEWRMGQGGFRTDTVLAGDSAVTLQGDAYAGWAGQRINITTYSPPFTTRVDDRVDLAGGNVVGRWTTGDLDSGATSLQAYYDFTSRREAAFEESRHTVDLDFQQSLTPARSHRLAWGAGYRVTSGDTRAVPIREFVPPGRTDQLFSGFVQDQFEVSPRIQLTAGAKIEHNDYSGLEIQPNANVSWAPTIGQALVVSVTRAVRTPSPVEEDYVTGALLNPAGPLFLRLVPNRDFEPESMTAYEAIYRVLPSPRAFFTLSTFLNHHRDVLSTVAGTPFVEAEPRPVHSILPIQFQNGLHGNSHGAEVTGDIRPREWIRVNASYSWLRIQLTRDPGAVDVSQELRNERGSPQHAARVSTALDLPYRVSFDWHLRYVSAVRAFEVPEYVTSDLRLAWTPSPRWGLEVVGRNLHQAHHLEFGGGVAGNVEVPRSVFGRLTLAW